MKLHLKRGLVATMFLLSTFIGTESIAQSSCCSSSPKTSCKTSSKSTSGCTPSNCRGARTKFGEAKILTALRGNLIKLKAKMEESQTITFGARSYDIHGIVGNSDDESLEIIVKEVKIIEEEFSTKLKYKASSFVLPENKAKQVEYLNARIQALQQLL